MPWKETTTMEQKVEFICEWLSRNYTTTELCRAFGISRPTAYRLIHNYEKYRIEGLLEKSKTPRNHPNKTPEKLKKRSFHLRISIPRGERRKATLWCISLYYYAKTFFDASTLCEGSAISKECLN